MEAQYEADCTEEGYSVFQSESGTLEEEDDGMDNALQADDDQNGEVGYKIPSKIRKVFRWTTRLFRLKQSEMTKKKWKNLRDTFSKEFKKNPKPRSGTDADNEPKYTGTWPHFEAMSFSKVVLKPRQTEGNIISQDSESNSVDLSVNSDTASPEEIFNTNASDNDNTQLPESSSILKEIPQNMSIDNSLRQDRPPSLTIALVARSFAFILVTGAFFFVFVASYHKTNTQKKRYKSRSISRY
ncbi:hypothetical protein PYW08_006498 [Mythimna loreyi]|uniref:Uncharacterized protein n=1 Tax=Mythimna loreyi TaxID=667449 RepID=A0ACC2QMS9_9NEOP|nr:hypothetical protein PYW08_006498 [Mythimna loreyi]